MRKIWLRFLGPAVLAAALLAGCSGGGETENVENAAADGVLTVGILAGENIFSYTDEAGQLRGVEPQLMERLGESLGVSVEFDEAGSLDELLNWLDLGQADIALGRIAQRDEYNQKYQVSRNYAKKGIYLLTRKNDYTDTLAGLAETTVAVAPSISAELRVDIPYLDQVVMQEYGSVADAAKALEEETVSAVILTEREAMEEIAQGSFQAQEMLNGPKESYVALMGSGQQELAASLNQVISQYLDEQAGGAEEENQTEETLPAQTGEEE